MKTILQLCAAALTGITILSACRNKRGRKTLFAPFMNAERQSRLTPDSVLAELQRGNLRFVEGNPLKRDEKEALKYSLAGQHPKAYVLSCIDSRVTVEKIFDQGVGDIFVGRVAGNVATIEQIGGMEYACAVAKARLIVVMGHERCGAVKAAIKGDELGNLTSLLDGIQQRGLMKYKKDRPDNEKFFYEQINEIARNNVRHSIERIRAHSEILHKMETEGKIKIVGAFFSIHDGKVTFL